MWVDTWGLAALFGFFSFSASGKSFSDFLVFLLCFDAFELAVGALDVGVAFTVSLDSGSATSSSVEGWASSSGTGFSGSAVNENI